MKIYINNEKYFDKAYDIFCESVNKNEVLYLPMPKNSFENILKRQDSIFAAAEKNGELLGFLVANTLREKAYITLVFVKNKYRNKGIGKGLIKELEGVLKAKGYNSIFIDHMNPVELGWRIPESSCTHNKIPGVYIESPAIKFFKSAGFSAAHEEIAMYRELQGFSMPEEILSVIENLKQEGIEVGELKNPYVDFSGLFDRLQSEYWRDSIASEIQAHKENRGNPNPRFWADGMPPKAPRKILAAVHEGAMVGFTGPVDVQKNLRGWFTGLCVDPNFGRRRIGETLFNLLLDAFQKEGAQFVSLYTGAKNPAQKIYLRAGLKPAARFAAMEKKLK
ncbi:MAG: GNAT family N-acetyltransferase [Christensenellales bacterium]|jgi:ribosomal protein S18 acetylase RimI-like enzyme